MSKPKSMLPFRLLVEGPEDEAIYGAFVNALFGRDKVFVRAFNGIDDITPGTISSELKGSLISSLAIAVDGDNDGQGTAKPRWPRVRQALESLGYENLPPESQPLPRDGLVIDQPPEGRPRCSLWVMPNNFDAGYLETFLWRSITLEHEDFPDHAELERHLNELPSTLKKFKPIHLDKSRFRTWLTWSSEPDLRTGNSIRRFFWERRQELPGLQPFLKWLQRAFPFNEEGTEY